MDTRLGQTRYWDLEDNALDSIAIRIWKGCACLCPDMQPIPADRGAPEGIGFSF
jgi:hypothetical protein